MTTPFEVNPPTRCFRSEHDYMVRPSTNSIGPCCKVWIPINQIDKYHTLVSDLKSGIRNPLCAMCWNAEDNNETSWRTIGNMFVRDVGTTHRNFELVMHNTCDLACLYCDPAVSSTFSQEYFSPKNTIKFINAGWKKPILSESFDMYELAFEHLDKLSEEALHNPITVFTSLIGGEPLLCKFVLNGGITTLVNRFYANGNTRPIIINLTTNGNTPLPIFNKVCDELKALHEVWPHMIVEIAISNESTFKNSEYIRYGLKWDYYVDIVKRWVDLDWAIIRFSMTVTPCSIKDTAGFITEMLSICNRQVQFGVNKVYYPENQNITLLDNSFVHYIDEAIEVVKANQAAMLFPDNTLERLYQLKSEIGTSTHTKSSMLQLFEYAKVNRGLDIVDVNPELYNYIIS